MDNRQDWSETITKQVKEAKEREERKKWIRSQSKRVYLEKRREGMNHPQALDAMVEELLEYLG